MTPTARRPLEDAPRGSRSRKARRRPCWCLGVVKSGILPLPPPAVEGFQHGLAGTGASHFQPLAQLLLGNHGL